MMYADQESLLSPSSSGGSPTRYSRDSSRWRKNIFLILISLLIGICLTVYFYLNLEAIKSNQDDLPARFKPLSRRKPMLDDESIYSESGPSLIILNDLLAHCVVALRIAGQEVVNLSLAHNDKLNQVGSKGKTQEGVNDVVTGADMRSHELILKTLKDSYRRLRVVSEEDTTEGFGNSREDILPINRKKFAQLLREDLDDIENKLDPERILLVQHETLVWIDPLDATKEYSENLTDYVTLMACIVHKSVPIAGKSYHSDEIKRALLKAKNNQQDDLVRVIVSLSHAGDVKNVLEKAYGKRASILSAGGSGYKTIEILKGKADVYMHLTHIKKWDVCAPYAILSSLKVGRMTDLFGNKIGFADPTDKVVTKGLIASLKPNIHEEIIRLTKDYNSVSIKD